MGKIIGFFIILIVLFIIISIIQNGTQSFKEHPIQSSVETSKMLKEKGENAVDYFQSINQNITKELIEIGKIPCAINEDCNVLQQCKNNLCICKGGSCFK